MFFFHNVKQMPIPSVFSGVEYTIAHVCSTVKSMVFHKLTSVTNQVENKINKELAYQLSLSARFCQDLIRFDLATILFFYTLWMKCGVMFYNQQEEQRIEIENKLEQKFKQEKEEIIQERRQLFLERRRKQFRIKLIEQKMEMAQNVSIC